MKFLYVCNFYNPLCSVGRKRQLWSILTFVSTGCRYKAKKRARMLNVNYFTPIPCYLSKRKAVLLRALEALRGRGGVAPTHS
jgi:hypothetical protein